MVFIAPDPSQILGPALAQLASGIGHAINPDYEIQQVMKLNLATNPELIGKLADAEAKAPGTLSTLGLGKLTGQITKTPESVESQVGREQRPTLKRTAEAGVKAGEAKSQIDVNVFTKAAELIRNDPKVTFDAALRQVLGETGAEHRAKESAANVAEAEEPAKIAGAQIETKAAKSAQENLPVLEGYDFDTAARSFLGGTMAGAEAAALMNTPGANKSFQEAIDAVKQERALATQEFMASFRADTTDDDLLTRQAFQLYTGTDYSGTLDAWKKVISDPRAADALRQKPIDQRTPEEKNIVAALDARDRYNRAAHTKQVNDLNATIRSAYAALNTAVFKGEPEDSQQLLLSNLNAALIERAGLTGQYYRAQVGKRPDIGEAAEDGWWWGVGKDQGLYFIDAQGKRVNPNDIFAPPAGKAMMIAARIQDLDVAEREKQLQALRNKGQADLANQVDSILKSSIKTRP